jgi:hypothetical protein
MVIVMVVMVMTGYLACERIQSQLVHGDGLLVLVEGDVAVPEVGAEGGVGAGVLGGDEQLLGVPERVAIL